ncbi:hypothetical protein JCM10908_005224 [Rhodotorula pacifica]|uniref:uncharacterized protein n=1 Tax=Rhodotorula pacifica TaxID=1495444 RepID=UPI00317A85CE
MSTQASATTEKGHRADIEAQHLNFLDAGDAGASLRRQISVQLSAEQFERLYLQPGGAKAKGDLSKRFGNPTPLGLACFLLCMTPFNCYLMGWTGTTTGAFLNLVDPFMFYGGVGLILAGIMEWIIGNTFSSLVFITFSGFFLSYGLTLQPSQGIAAALASDPVNYYGGQALYLVWFAVLILIFLVAALRTNVIFVLVFTCLDIAIWLQIASYIKLAHQDFKHVESLTKASGAFGFATTMLGTHAPSDFARIIRSVAEASLDSFLLRLVPRNPRSSLAPPEFPSGCRLATLSGFMAVSRGPNPHQH